MKWIILLSGIVANASASVLIKIAMTSAQTSMQLHNPMSVIFSLPLMGGLALYGAAFVLYAVALTLFPLNVAHPVMTSGAVALVAVCSSLLFGEAFSLLKLTGLVLVIAGVFAITSG